MTNLELLKNEEQHYNINGQIHDSGETKGVPFSVSKCEDCIYVCSELEAFFSVKLF